MIFLTVGTQLPFDRLIKDMDDISQNLNRPIFGQIGKTSYFPKHFEYSNMVHPLKFDELCKSSDIIVSHAGIGSILTAQKYSKPVVIVPRLAKFGEHRNDHQLATCENMKSYKGVYTAMDSTELLAVLRLVVFELPSLEAVIHRRKIFVSNLKQQIDSLGRKV